MPVIIDGHNLLWSIQNPEEGISVTDAGLCKLLDRYFGITGDKAEIIFDGIGPPDKTEFNSVRNIEITFSGRNTDCDTIIEHRIRDCSALKLLTIVSSDRRLRDAAESRKAISLKCEDFWAEVQKKLSKQKKSKEPSGKRTGVTDSETELWLKAFGLDRQQPPKKQ